MNNEATQRDFLQINKLSHLHNGTNIIFCKTDYLHQEFENIKNLNNDVILISGNSDYPINENYLSILPKNVKKWFAQNTLLKSEILEPLPIGLENKLYSERNGHGIGYFERVNEKESLLSKKNDIIPTKLIYSNFNINTNFAHRNECKIISNKTEFIDWEENNLNLESYFNKILQYEIVLCPAGNGVDTHRLWETLYSNRIPLTIKMGDYKIYELYSKLPIIVLNNINELYDKSLIISKLDEIKNTKYDLSLLETSYWINRIKKIKL